MNPLSWIISQFGRPRGVVGRVLARGMNRSHAPMMEWVLTQVSPQGSKTVLDIGCGGGAALLRMAELAPQAELHGVDYSPRSLEVAARTNRRLLRQGRVFLQEADVSALPYDDGHFDLAMAMNSHYFWPDLEAALGEILRVLQPHGLLALAGGEYLGGKHDKRNRKLASNGRMNFQTLPELRSMLSEAGFSSTAIHEEWDRGWFCVAGHKPGGEVNEWEPTCPSDSKRRCSQ